MLAEDSTEAESVVPGDNQEAPDAGQVGMCVELPVCIQTEQKCETNRNWCFICMCEGVGEIHYYGDDDG